MPVNRFDIAVPTDAIALDPARAFEQGGAWGLRRYALRRAASGPFPYFSRSDLHVVEDAVAAGNVITTVVCGILKGPVEDRERLVPDVERVLPLALERAQQFDCGRVAVHGFERYPGEPDANRLLVLRAFERVAEAADAAGLVLTVTNEPGFWVDRPKETAALLAELGHPALRVRWDPAAAVQSGHRIGEADVEALQPYLSEVLVRDGSQTDAGFVWKPLGEGQVPWPEILHWLNEAGAAVDLTLACGDAEDAPDAGWVEDGLDRLGEFVREAGIASAQPDAAG